MNSGLERKIRRVLVQDADYPQGLRELADPPPVLYIKGRWPLSQNLHIGVVGPRKATLYGLEVAKQFTADFVRRDIVTVSGLAAGVDACCHRVTLDEGGWTVAVLGHGFGHFFPKENIPLFEQIAERGTIVTEFEFDTKPEARHFPRRNRIISGLSKGVLVAEASFRSGALITARYAAEQGRDVFVAPGSIFSPLSRGCHRLIKEGAMLVECAQDILDEYGFEEHQAMSDVQKAPVLHEPLNTMEKELLELLSCIPVSVDELADVSGRAADQLAETLLSLELKGRIQAMPGQRYVTYT